MATGHGGDDLAPVIPLFPGTPSVAPAYDDRAAAYDKVAAYDDKAAGFGDDLAAFDDDYDDDDGVYDSGDSAGGLDECTAIERDIADNLLVRKLRTRQLSISEARTVLTERPIPAEVREQIIDDFCRRGYLDDALLAEQIIHTAVERKGQGRRVIAQALAKRGIARDVADAALEQLPDDDAQRALEYARTKAVAMARLDPEVATRRLAGQLARRGYPGSVALTAAKQALTEASGPPGVRFR